MWSDADIVLLSSDFTCIAAMFRYLVCYRGLNKLVKVEDKSQLKSKCAELFGCDVQSVFLEVFLEEFGDYADIPRCEDVPDQGKIRLRADLNIASIHSASTEPATSDIEIRFENTPQYILPGTTTASVQGDEFEADNPQVASGGDGRDDSQRVQPGAGDEQVPEASANKKVPEVNTRGNRDSSSHKMATHHLMSSANDWFAPETLSLGLRKKLELKADLTRKDWSEITDTLFEGFFRETSSVRPSAQQYLSMAASVLDKFPYLKQDLALHDALGMVRGIIKDKFKNNRKRRASSVSQIEEDNSRPPSKRLKAVAGLPGYCPPFDQGDAPDMMAMSNQLQLVDCSPTEVESLLSKTFAWRRHLVVQDNMPIRDIIRLFPGLFVEDEFWREVGRMAGGRNAQEELRGRLLSHMEHAKEKLKCDIGDVIGQIGLCLGGRKIPQESADETMSPQLVSEVNRFQVVAEGVTVLTITDFVNALVAWVMCHSVFNTVYGKSDKMLGIYLQRLVLKVDDGLKVPTRAVKLYSRLAASGAE